jgi:simple sugar transport system substrate-binding protein
MKKIFAFLLVAMTLALSACGTKVPTSEENNNENSGTNNSSGSIVLGFSQLGAESDWRAANTDSMKEAAKKVGIELLFEDAQQKQENQIKQIRQFIAEKVDVIAFSPVVTSGWDDVLKEAKTAKIPVILVDRSIDTKDSSFYITHIGSDFKAEGVKAAKWLEEKMKGNKGTVNIVELQGTAGSSAAVGRQQGFAETIKSDANFKMLDSKDGEFTQAGGKEVMAGFLKKYGKTINVVYSHNDEMSLGAISAIEEAGLKPGKDITIISFDATKKGFAAMVAGKINVDVECNPQMGPRVMDLVKDIKAGKTIEKEISTNEGIFPAETAAKELPNRKY